MIMTKAPDLLFRTERMLLPNKDHLVMGEVAVKDGRICSLVVDGTMPLGDRRGMDIVELGNDILAPAFYDSHMHLFQWSMSRSAVDLSVERSWSEVMEKLKAVRTGMAGNDLFERSGVLVGVDYDDSTFVGGPCPTMEYLDRTFRDVPVLIRRICGHVMFINSAAAEMLGVTDTDMLKGPLMDDAAMTASWTIPFGTDSFRTGLSKGVRELWSLGIAGGVEIVPSMALDSFLDHFQGCGGGPKLSLCIVDGNGRKFKGLDKVPADWTDFSEGPDDGVSTTVPKVVFEKHFMDGSIGSRTASFSREFSDIYPDVVPLLDPKTLTEEAAAGYDRGHLPMVHAIGDRASSSAIMSMVGLDLPFRIEHAEAVTGKQLEKLKGSKGCLSLQPNFQRVWGSSRGLYGQSLGHAYVRLNPFGTIVRSGVPWCFGSDMMPVGPLYGIAGATGHPNPGERLDMITAFRGYSEASAKYSLPGSMKHGMLAEGAAADLAVLSPDHGRVKALYINGTLKTAV